MSTEVEPGSDRAAAPAAPQAPSAPPTPAEARPSTFASLGDSGFRWFFASMLGQMASLNMQGLVRGYLAFELTGSFAALGTLFLFNAAPGILLALYGGVLADRARSRKRIVQTGQLINATNALVVGLLLFGDALCFEHLLVASFLQGAVNSLMMPARQAMLPEVVGLQRLMNAVALNAAGRDSIRLLAPAAGGALLTIFGAEWIYFLMAAMYLFASAALVRVHTSAAGTGGDPPRRRRGGAGGAGDVLEGLRYVRRDRTLGPLLLFNILFALLAMPYVFMLPGFVADVLEEGPGQLGLLMSLTGAGSLAGAMVIASLPSRRRGRLLLGAVALQGVGLVAFASSTALWLTAPIMLLIGFAEAGRMSLSNVLVQTYVEDEFRGRVMSVYMLQRSLAQFGAFFAGFAASAVGIQLVLGGMAALLVLLALGVAVLLPHLRTLD